MLFDDMLMTVGQRNDKTHYGKKNRFVICICEQQQRVEEVAKVSVNCKQRIDEVPCRKRNQRRRKVRERRV